MPPRIIIPFIRSACTKRIRPSPTRLRVELWNSFQRNGKKKKKTEEFWQCVNRIVLPVTELQSGFKHLSQVNQGKHVFWALGQLNELPLFIISLCRSCMLSSSIYWKLWCMCIMCIMWDMFFFLIVLFFCSRQRRAQISLALRAVDAMSSRFESSTRASWAGKTTSVDPLNLPLT